MHIILSLVVVVVVVVVVAVVVVVIVIITTVHTTTEIKVQNIFHGRNNITCSTNSKYSTAATLYTLDTWFVSGI
jgi:hypothetical protein